MGARRYVVQRDRVDRHRPALGLARRLSDREPTRGTDVEKSLRSIAAASCPYDADGTIAVGQRR